MAAAPGGGAVLAGTFGSSAWVASFDGEGGHRWSRQLWREAVYSVESLAVTARGEILLGGAMDAHDNEATMMITKLDAEGGLVGSCVDVATPGLLITADAPPESPTNSPVAFTVGISSAGGPPPGVRTAYPEVMRRCLDGVPIVTSADPLILPDAVAGCRASRGWLMLRNDGQQVQTVVSADMQPPGVFSMADPSILPLTVPPGDSRGVGVIFTPPGAGETRGVLTIGGNDMGGTPWTIDVELRGTGAPAAARTDTFKRIEGEVYDVITCADVETGMRAAQKRFGEWAAAEAPASGASWRYGVALSIFDGLFDIATGVGSYTTVWPGGMMPDSYDHGKIIADDIPEPWPITFTGEGSRDFHALSDINEYETARPGGCLESIRLALQPERLADPARNLGLVRDGGALSIVIVSTRDDRSPLDVASYVDAFQRIGRDHRKSQVAAFIAAPFNRDGGPANPPAAEACASKPGSEAASRYLAFLTRLGSGEAVSICDDTWGFSPGAVFGGPVPSHAPEYFLSRNPDAAGVTVKVDGSPIPPDPVKGYWYEPAENRIRFGSDAALPAGAAIQATYRPACDP